MSLFLDFCACADAVGSVSSRLEKARLVGEYFAALPDADLKRAALYLGGYRFPLREGRTVNVGGALLLGAIQGVSGADETWLRERLVRTGDPGDLAFEAWTDWKGALQTGELTLENVENELALLAQTTQTFAHGRVRVVEPHIVIEVAFDRVQPSSRHKSGFALRFPRIVRLRDDKPASEIDTLDTVRQLAGEGST